ncbi:MAG: RNA-binding protein [Parcubacteria group bacterium]|nr:RNA-binding protein [Parcubacteria group bacterium]
MEKDQEFVDFIVRAIVGNPDDVRVERTIDERGVLLTLHVNPEDMGYVIGKRGETAQAIRRLLSIVGRKYNANVAFKIYEPEGSRREDRAPRQESNDAPNYDDVDTSAVEDINL